MFKKLFTPTLVIVFALIFAVCANANSSISTPSGTSDIGTCVKLSMEFLDSFYEAVYLNEKFESPVTIADSDYQTIIQAKLENLSAPMILTPCESIEITYKEPNVEVSGNYVYVEFPIAVEYTLECDTAPCDFGCIEYFRFEKVNNSYVLDNWCTSSDMSFDFSIFDTGYFVFLRLEEYSSWLEEGVDYSEYVSKAVEKSANRVNYFNSMKANAESETVEEPEIIEQTLLIEDNPKTFDISFLAIISAVSTIFISVFIFKKRIN